MVDNESNQSFKFRTKNWAKINDQSRGLYNTNIGSKFKTTMLKSNLRNYSDVYILAKGRITITGAAKDAASRQAHEINKEVIFIETVHYYIEIDNAKDIDIVMPMYNFM